MTFDYNKICRLCLNSSNTYLMNIFNSEYSIVEKVAELVSLEVFQHDPFPKVICTDCYSNLVIFSEFKKICINADALLKKYQINKADSPEVDTTHSTKGNGKCKSIRNSDDMALRIRETAYKKSLTFVENMKSFYFLLNQIEDLENGSAQAIIKNEISTESLIPTVEINIKNEVIYPSDENQMIPMSSVIQQNPESSGETKRKKRKNNKRKAVNGQTMEIDETGNIVARQIAITTDQQQQPQNIQISQNDNEMALMLTVKSVEQDQGEVDHQQTLQQPAQIQIHSNHALPSITHHPSSSAASSTVTSPPQTITFLFPFSTTSSTGAPNEQHYQQVTLPQSSVSQIVTTIQPPANQQFPAFTHKKYFDSEFLKHMIHNAPLTSSPASQQQQPIPMATSTIQKVTTIVERDQTDMSSIPTDLSSSTSTQYK